MWLNKYDNQRLPQEQGSLNPKRSSAAESFSSFRPLLHIRQFALQLRAAPGLGATIRADQHEGREVRRQARAARHGGDHVAVLSELHSEGASTEGPKDLANMYITIYQYVYM